MEQKRTLHFTSPGFRSQEIIIAPDLDESTSKRRPWIEDEVCFIQLIVYNMEMNLIFINMFTGQNVGQSNCRT